MTPSYFAKVRPTYIENWGDALVRLSLPQTDIPLSLTEARALLAAHGGGSADSCESGSSPPVNTIVERLGDALRGYPGGAFVRLGSRSGKDSRYARRHGLRVFRPEAAVRMLTEGSRRVAFDLRLALRYDYQPHIFVRQWCEIPAWAEFRCFMKGRKLVGTSQYDCKNLGRRPEIAGRAERLKAAIDLFFEEVRAASHLDDVVFDVFINVNEGNRDESIGVKLLELNPFIPATDACLFSWSGGGDFDGSFRFL